MAACKHLIIIVVFYLYFLTGYQAKLNYLTKQQCSKYLVPITNSTFGKEEGRKLVFGHFQLYSLLSPTMIQQTNKSRCAKNKQYQRILKSKSCKHQLRSFLHLLVLMLMLCGDIHPNPGPVVKSGTKKRTPKFPCSVCDKGLISSSKAVSCDRCDNWTHIMCCEVSVDDYNLCLNSGKPISHVCNVCLLREMVHQNFDETLENQTLVNPANYDDVADDCVYEPFSKKGLHFLHLNARSLLSKLSDVRLLVNNSKAAVLAVSETWLDGSVL